MLAKPHPITTKYNIVHRLIATGLPYHGISARSHRDSCCSWYDDGAGSLLASFKSLTFAIAQQRNGSTPNTQPPLSAGYPGVVSAATPSNPLAGLALPQPTNSGSLDLSSIKPANSGTVSLADAIAKARGSAADKGNSPMLLHRHLSLVGIFNNCFC